VLGKPEEPVEHRLARAYREDLISAEEAKKKQPRSAVSLALSDRNTCGWMAGSGCGSVRSIGEWSESLQEGG
jgi:hypothetical protein